MDSTPLSRSSRAARRTASSSSGFSTSPCGPQMRSGTGRRWRRATSGCFCHGRSSCRLKLEGRLLRAMWRMSRTLRCEHAAARAVMLHDDVGGDGGSVHEVVDGIERDARRLHELPQTFHRSPRGIVSDRGHLVDADVPRFLVDQHEIGMGAPDVYPDTETGLGCFSFSLLVHKVMTHIQDCRFRTDLHRRNDPAAIGRIAFRAAQPPPVTRHHHPQPTTPAPRARCTSRDSSDTRGHTLCLVGNIWRGGPI